MILVRPRCKRGRQWLLVAVAVWLCSGWLAGHAGQPFYTYVDERGHLVATDRLEEIPPRYRDRVTVRERAGAPAGARESTASWLDFRLPTMEQLLYRVIDRLPARVIPGLSTYQSVILIGGILLIVLFYAAGKLTKGAFWRLLMPWGIGITAVMTLYYMFISDLGNKVAARDPAKSTGSILNIYKRKSQHISEQQQQRLQEFDQRHERD